MQFIRRMHKAGIAALSIVLGLLAGCGGSNGNPLSHTSLSFDSSSKTLTVVGQDPSVTLYVSGNASDMVVQESASGPAAHQANVVNLSIQSAGSIQLGAISISGNLSVNAGKDVAVGGAITTN